MPVISVGDYAQPFQLAHWFEEEENSGKRIKFVSPCKQIDYNIGSKKVVVLPKFGVIYPDSKSIAQGKIILTSLSDLNLFRLQNKARVLDATGVTILRDEKQLSDKINCALPLFVVSAADHVYTRKTATAN